jgi:valyl-tRNA synthetase
VDDTARTVLEERTRYDPGVVEPAVFARWQEAHAFDAEPGDPGEPYCIAIPPPNVTGALHMGHALNGTIQDVLIRLARMRGRNALWAYGKDHAGIAVVAVLEKELARDGLSRHEIGREAFVERAWAWVREYGGTITGQFKRLGCSLDYRRERFTMDEGYVQAVLHVFVSLYRKGYLFRDSRIVNWCPVCESAISDLEVRHLEVDDHLYEVDYPLVGGGHVTVATVRPATMLGDTAVAVNPADERYRDLVGRTAIVPLVEREVPVIADEHVEMGFGTGALKITPGHDPNDFEIGRRHGLPEITVIGFDGRMTEAAGPRYAGLATDETSDLVVADLEERGLLRERRPYRHSVGHCDRTGNRIEPLVSLQWFCEMTELARPANAAVREGRVVFHPRSSERIYFDWMDNIRPWCVSRQQWWGHQLPVWYCSCGETIVQETAPTSCPACRSGELERDPDVLDTWFSSALWPFAILGWPEDTPELRTWFPTQVLSTARDIINLWVARMMMTSLEFMGTEPFADVNVHSIILAPDGRRMSKSLGTGTDPLDLIAAHGADATRYGLLKMSSTQDVRFSEVTIEEGRGLANKLWNASRLVLLNVEDVEPAPLVREPVDAWILGRLDDAIQEIGAAIDGFDLAAAVKALYRFVWNDVCDWYLEAAKLRLYGDDPDARREVSATLLHVLDRTLRLAHPVLPHVTEEIWSLLPDRDGQLVRASWPETGEVPRDTERERSVESAIALVAELRRLRAEAELGPREPLTVAVDDGGLAGNAALVSGLGHVEVSDGSGGIPVAADGLRARVLGAELAARLRPRVEARLATARDEAERASRKLADARFVEKAPAALVAAEREKAERYAGEVGDLERRLAALGQA